MRDVVADLFSRPILIGYMAGVALLLVVDQLGKLTGDIEDYPQAHTIPGLVVYRYDSPLFFANAQDFRRRALVAVADQSAPVRWFVLNTEANVEVDITALDSLEALRKELTERGIVFALARVKQDLRTELDAYGLSASVGEERIFPTLPVAVAAYQECLRPRSEGGK